MLYLPLIRSRNAAQLLCAAMLALGCSEESATLRPEGSSGRSEAVAAPADNPITRFCDRSFGPGERPLRLPELIGTEVPAIAAGSNWRWINVWASWCGPCLREMPLLASWSERLAGTGDNAVSFYFISTDEQPALDDFVRAHPELPASSRLGNAADQTSLLNGLGLDAGGSLPVHALVDPAGNIRCVRTGSVEERNFPTVQAILRTR